MKVKDIIQEARSPEEFMSQLRSTAPDIKQVYQKYLKSPHYRPFRTSDDSTSEYHNWTDNFAQFLRKEFGHMPQDLAFEIGNHLYDYIKMRNREDPEGVAENDPNSSSSSFDTNIGNVKLGASSSGLTASVGSPPGVSASITASPSNLKNPTVGLSAGNPNQGLSGSVSAPANNLSNPSAMIQYKKTFEKKIGESGSFSYGAKKPRKGSVADLADKKRQEQERGKQPIEPKDQMVGVAKVTKGVAEGIFDFTKQPMPEHGDELKIGDRYVIFDDGGSHYGVSWIKQDRSEAYEEFNKSEYTNLNQLKKAIWDEIKYQDQRGVAEGKKPDRYHIVDKDGKPVNLASYADKASAIKDRDEKYPGAVVQQVGPRGKVKDVAEGSLNEGQYEMMMRNGQVKKFIAKDDADAKRIAAGHGAKSVIRLKGGVPAGKVAEQGVAEGFPYDVDHMPGKTTKHTSTNCTTCHGRKSMYKVDGKLFADNKPGATKVKCPVCKGTGDKQGVAEQVQTCSECGGPSYSNPMLAEKKDACYHKVKSRVKVWPSAYASGQLVQCRKRGASNWGTGGKKK